MNMDKNFSFQAICVLDFEATCEKERKDQAIQEIIEFPGVLLKFFKSPSNCDQKSVVLEKVSEFQAYIKPKHCPKLSQFCTDLTGIQQTTIDQKGVTFPKALRDYTMWIKEHLNGNEPSPTNVLIVTCGDWDLKTMLPKQCDLIENMKPPSFLSQWCNLKFLFDSFFFKGKKRCKGMTDMLDRLNLELHGRHHSGIDDCRNIASIVKELWNRGCALVPTAFRGNHNVSYLKYDPFNRSMNYYVMNDSSHHSSSKPLSNPLSNPSSSQISSVMGTTTTTITTTGKIMSISEGKKDDIPSNSTKMEMDFSESLTQCSSSCNEITYSKNDIITSLPSSSVNFSTMIKGDKGNDIDIRDFDPIKIIGPKEKNNHIVPQDYMIINSTSRTKEKWSIELSPFHLGPVSLYGGLKAENMENAWQFSKVYKEHVDEKQNPTQKYWEWAIAGWNDKKAQRFPMGRDQIPEYSYWNGLKLDYITARKVIYAPLYAKLVEKTNAFKRLKSLYIKHKGKIAIFDYDGYDYVGKGMSLKQVLEDGTMKMGHSFVLAMLLTNQREWERFQIPETQFKIPQLS